MSLLTVINESKNVDEGNFCLQVLYFMAMSPRPPFMKKKASFPLSLWIRPPNRNIRKADVIFVIEENDVSVPSRVPKGDVLLDAWRLKHPGNML